MRGIDPPWAMNLFPSPSPPWTHGPKITFTTPPTYHPKGSFNHLSRITSIYNFLGYVPKPIRGALGSIPKSLVWLGPAWGREFCRVCQGVLYILNLHKPPLTKGGVRRVGGEEENNCICHMRYWITRKNTIWFASGCSLFGIFTGATISQDKITLEAK